MVLSSMLDLGLMLTCTDAKLLSVEASKRLNLLRITDSCRFSSFDSIVIFAKTALLEKCRNSNSRSH